MADDQLKRDFASDITLLRFIGLNPVVVHGGGPQINQVLDQMGIATRFVRGMRLTDAPTMDVVEMVLAGLINKRVVAAINAQGGRSVGLSGKDANLMVCRQTDPALGFVGTPWHMNTDVLRTLFAAKIIPVIAPLGVGEDGQSYNVNGDTAAGAIAGALKARRLLLLTDVAGVKDETGEVITDLTASEVRRLTDAGVIAGGMIPKTETALSALQQGVRAVVILDGRAPNACLLELFTDHGAGSIIRSM